MRIANEKLNRISNAFSVGIVLLCSLWPRKLNDKYYLTIKQQASQLDINNKPQTARIFTSLRMHYSIFQIIMDLALPANLPKLSKRKM